MSQNARRQGHVRGQRSPSLALRFDIHTAAWLTGSTVRTLRRHIAARRLAVVRTRGKLFIMPAALRTWLGHSPHIPWNSHPSKTWGGVSVGVYAAVHGLTPREVRHQIDKGALTAEKIGGRLRVNMGDIDIR